MGWYLVGLGVSLEGPLRNARLEEIQRELGLLKVPLPYQSHAEGLVERKRLFGVLDAQHGLREVELLLDSRIFSALDDLNLV